VIFSSTTQNNSHT